MKVHRPLHTALSALAALALAVTPAFPKSPDASNQPVSIIHAGDLDSTYEAVLNEVKKEGFSVDSSSKDAGVKTAVTVAGRYHQTGSHLELQFIQDSANQTTVRVAAIEQTRYKALKTEPWSSPKVSPDQSTHAAEKLKAGLGW